MAATATAVVVVVAISVGEVAGEVGILQATPVLFRIGIEELTSTTIKIGGISARLPHQAQDVQSCALNKH
jgi:hypothetical protein